MEGRAVEAAFDGGLVTSDAGALLLGSADRAINLVGRFADCFRDRRRQDLIEHAVDTSASGSSASRSAMKISTTMTSCGTIR